MAQRIESMKNRYRSFEIYKNQSSLSGDRSAWFNWQFEESAADEWLLPKTGIVGASWGKPLYSSGRRLVYIYTNPL